MNEDAYKFLLALESRRALTREANKASVVLWEHLKKIRKYLTPQEYTILKLMLYERQDFETVGKKFGLSRERIRLILDRTIMKVQKLSSVHFDFLCHKC